MKYKKKQFSFLLLIILSICLLGCKDSPLPKPKALLRLEYPKTSYTTTKLKLPFNFKKNTAADTLVIKQLDRNTSSYGINIEYSKLNGTIFLTYKRVSSKTQLIKYIKDAQNFILEHTKKADAIKPQEYLNTSKKSFGTFYHISGNAASQAQFYITDSTHHFLTGALYFNTRPNFDSIYPASEYLKKDMRKIMETIVWK